MKNLTRIFLEKIPLKTREAMMSEVAAHIRLLTKPQKIIYFGSIISDNFDSYSDIDIVVIYESREQADEARRSLYGSHRPDLGHPIEFLCVDKATYSEKSQIGGVYAIAKDEGRIF